MPNLQSHIRQLERELAKAKDREALLVEMIRSLQRQMERDRIHTACFKRRYQSN